MWCGSLLFTVHDHRASPFEFRVEELERRRKRRRFFPEFGALIDRIRNRDDKNGMFVMPTFLTHTWGRIGAIIGAGVVFLIVASTGQANPAFWQLEWPETDFSKHSVPFDEIFSGGVPRDGIPPIYDPNFASIEKVAKHYEGTEPVIEVSVDGKARAYPLGILMTHEIVNDELAGKKIAVTYCPLCNSAVVFDRNVNGNIHTFGVSGKLRNSDLVMWDHETQSWWQQFTGVGIVGQETDTQLTMLPVKVVSFDKFKEAHPQGEVLLSPRGGAGFNPYQGYDTSSRPFLYRGSFPEDIRPLDYVVAVEGEAWSLDLLSKEMRVETDELVLTWESGQNAAMDRRNISKGRDIGNVTVQRKEGDKLVDAVHDVTFAFSFHAFNPDGPIHK